MEEYSLYGDVDSRVWYLYMCSILRVVVSTKGEEGKLIVGYFLFATTELLVRDSGCLGTGVRGTYRYSYGKHLCVSGGPVQDTPPLFSGLLTWGRNLYSSAIGVLLVCIMAIKFTFQGSIRFFINTLR